MTNYEYFEKNKSIIKDLYGQGYISARLIFHYRIFCDWKKLPKTLGKMDRYQEVADNNRVSTRTVISAIKKMKENI